MKIIMYIFFLISAVKCFSLDDNPPPEEVVFGDKRTQWPDDMAYEEISPFNDTAYEGNDLSPENVVFGDYGELSKNGIYGGDFIQITEVPYLAQVLEDGSQVCGGSIISEIWILTAAHCFEEHGKISIITGSTSRGTGGQRHEVAKIIVHKEYDNETMDNDIALLQLKKPIQFNEIQKNIEISTKSPKANEKLKVSGFGKEGDNLPSPKTLKAANLIVIDDAECEQSYKGKESDDVIYEDVAITKNMFCANAKGSDACQGDSGGPAVINNKLAGVVSFGLDCGDPNFPGIYTRVVNYRKWIAEQTKLKLKY